jgi:predicted transcriptional regulator
MSHRLQVLLPEDLEARLRKAAGRSRRSKSRWVRDAIEGKLTREASAAPRDPLTALAGLDAPTADIDVMLAEIDAGRR